MLCQIICHQKSTLSQCCSIALKYICCKVAQMSGRFQYVIYTLVPGMLWHHLFHEWKGTVSRRPHTKELKYPTLKSALALERRRGSLFSASLVSSRCPFTFHMKILLERGLWTTGDLLILLIC